MENRGRDVAPKLVGFADQYAHYDIFLFLHTKKSPHLAGLGLEWANYLLENLIPSPEGVTSIINLLHFFNVGIVFPQHHPSIRPMLNWGYDYENAANLLSRMGVRLDRRFELEFPSGSMFWGRTKALAGLLELNLSFSDFDPEEGQIDGTLAHAIERIILYAAEARQFTWLKTTISSSLRDGLPKAYKIDQFERISDAFSKVYRPLLQGGAFQQSHIAKSNPELRKQNFFPSPIHVYRINLLVPTINPKEVYGGISTALQLFEELSRYLIGRAQFRIIVTDASLSDDLGERYDDFVICNNDCIDTNGEKSILVASGGSVPFVTLRANDIFLATAWWTADLAFQAKDAQQLMFGQSHPILYLIQDFEPNFYGWSSRWVMAERTYRRQEETIAIINAEELYLYMTSQYRFPLAFCLPFKINEAIKQSFRVNPERKRLILIYGRPSVARNGYELIIDSLYAWQQRHPQLASRWEIVSLGETIKNPPPLANFQSYGKVSLQKYGEYLCQAAIGISLMFSMHPSYPPLEMAEAGIQVITNIFDGKDLSMRNANIVSIDDISVDAICDTLAHAVRQFEGLGSIASLDRKIPFDHEIDYYSPQKLFEALIPMQVAHKVA